MNNIQASSELTAIWSVLKDLPGTTEAHAESILNVLLIRHTIGKRWNRAYITYNKDGSETTRYYYEDEFIREYTMGGF